MNASNKLAPITGSYYVHMTEEAVRKMNDINLMDRISSCMLEMKTARSFCGYNTEYEIEIEKKEND